MKILVTGASSGIGKALSEYLANRGDIVWGIGLQKEKLEEIKKSLKQKNFKYNLCNVRQVSEVLKTKAIMEKSGFFPDVIILAAGISKDDINPLDFKRYREIFSVNLFGALNFVDTFLPGFIRRGSGQFIALSSIAAFRPNKRGVGYPASKAALSLTFRGLDLKYKEKNIHFSNIYLGPVATSMWEGGKSFLVEKPENAARKIAKVIKTKKNISFIPFLSTFLSRVSLLIPDRIYSSLAEKIKR